jgi:hypothetical protein
MGQTTLKKLLRQRVFRFLVGGGIAAAFDLLLISFMIELLELNAHILRNVANAVSIELSLLFNFSFIGLGFDKGIIGIFEKLFGDRFLSTTYLPLISRRRCEYSNINCVSYLGLVRC